MAGETQARDFLGRPKAAADGNPRIVPPTGFRTVGEISRDAGGSPGGDDGGLDAGTVDPVAVGQANPDAKRRPGRPRKSAGSGTASEAEGQKAALAVEEFPPTVVEQIALGLLIVNGGLISADEAQALAKAIANVAKYYIRLAASNKATAWAALLITAAMIYGPKIMAAQTAKREAAQRAARAEAEGQAGVEKGLFAG